MMIISVQCPACHTSFPVDPRKVPDGGVKVRCSVCSGIFFVEKPQLPEAPVAAVPPVATPAPPEPAVDEAPDPVEPPPPVEEVPESEDAVSFDPDGLDDLDPPVESDKVDPWSGSGWGDPAEMGAADTDDAPDPWSGGMGLDAPQRTEWERTEPAPEPEAEPASEPAPSSDSDWVVEHTHADGMQSTDAPIERVDTVEEETRVAAEDLAEEFDAELETSEDWSEAPIPESMPAVSAPVELPEPEVPAAAPEVTAPAPEVAPAPSGFQFGKRDPKDKAKRLARVLVSDIITYNPDRHQMALERNSLHADFEEEIRKSWAEYVEQVGSEIAESTPYWFDALNEILARGEKVF